MNLFGMNFPGSAVFKAIETTQKEMHDENEKAVDWSGNWRIRHTPG
jgi:hypothetical protein